VDDLWNSLDENVIACDSLNGFKNILDNILYYTILYYTQFEVIIINYKMIIIEETRIVAPCCGNIYYYDQNNLYTEAACISYDLVAQQHVSLIGHE